MNQIMHCTNISAFRHAMMSMVTTASRARYVVTAPPVQPWCSPEVRAEWMEEDTDTLIRTAKSCGFACTADWKPCADGVTLELTLRQLSAEEAAYSLAA